MVLLTLNHLHVAMRLNTVYKRGDLLNDKLLLLWTLDIDTITYIIRMLDEQENTGTKEFLTGDCEDERERE